MDRIGRYEVEEELGRGAMGVVYLARDPRVRRLLALKTCQLPEGIDPEEASEFRQRFVREAQSAGALNHPAIVTIYDVDQDTADGSPYITMEYVPGRTLRQYLRENGPLEPRRVVDLGKTIAGALYTAHAEGIVHRDIKPANILVRDPDGVFKLADFGIARLTGSSLTDSNLAMGSPAYMSPEQIQSDEIDGRSDLFSLATVLYEALCGRRPFEGTDLAALAYAVVHRQPEPVSCRRAGLPPSLDAFFLRAMAKTADGRFADGRSFASALEEAWEHRSVAPDAAVVGDGGVDARLAGPVSGEQTPSSLLISSPGLSPRGSEGSGPYKPRSPAQILQRAQAEHTLTEMPVIPLHRHASDREAGTGSMKPPAIRFRRSWWPRLLLLAGLIAGVLLADSFWQALPVPPPGRVTLQVEHGAGSGSLSIFSDGQLLYVGSLDSGAAASAGSTEGSGDQRPTVSIAAGHHLFTVQVKPRDGARSYQEQVQVYVREGGRHRLRIVTGTEAETLPVLQFE